MNNLRIIKLQEIGFYKKFGVNVKLHFFVLQVLLFSFPSNIVRIFENRLRKQKTFPVFSKHNSSNLLAQLQRALTFTICGFQFNLNLNLSELQGEHNSISALVVTLPNQTVVESGFQQHSQSRRSQINVQPNHLSVDMGPFRRNFIVSFLDLMFVDIPMCNLLTLVVEKTIANSVIAMKECKHSRNIRAGLYARFFPANKINNDSQM